MRKSIAIISMVMLMIGSSLNLWAKPPYCEIALQKCYDRCNQLFDYPLDAFCYGGCLIGYAGCGEGSN